MKVPGYMDSKIGNAYLRQTRATQHMESYDSVSDSPEAKKDEIALSALVTEILEFENLAKSIPEVRKDKVEAIKGQIESKTYVVNGGLVANSMAEFLS